MIIILCPITHVGVESAWGVFWENVWDLEGDGFYGGWVWMSKAMLLVSELSRLPQTGAGVNGYRDIFAFHTEE